MCPEGEGDAAEEMADCGRGVGRAGPLPFPLAAIARTGSADGRERRVRAAAGKMAAAQAQRPLKMVAGGRARARVVGGERNGADGPARPGGGGGPSAVTSQGAERGQAAPRECGRMGGLPRVSWAPAAWPCCSFPWEGMGHVTKLQGSLSFQRKCRSL